MRKPAATKDWRPAVAQIVAAVGALGKADTALQRATFAMLEQSARLAQAALDDDRGAVLAAARKTERALRKVISNLDD